MQDTMHGCDDVRDLIRRVQKIGIISRARAGGLPPGLRASLFRARGIEFEGLREYVPGDDIRALDWKVSARKDRPYVRTFTEDREQTFYIVVDRSGSAGFGSTRGRDEKMLDAAASLLFAAEKNHERTGLCIFTDRVECFVRARQGRAHIVHLLSVLLRHRPEGTGTDIAGVMRFLAGTLTRRCSVIILSDFFSPAFERELRILRARHEVIAIRVADPRETELPDAGLVALEDMETGEQLIVDTSDAAFRERYREITAGEDAGITAVFGKCRTGAITLASSDASLDPLCRFFLAKRRE